MGLLCHSSLQFISCLWLLCISICRAAKPSAIAVPVGSDWYGDDGNWSPVNIRVGYPPQWVSVFPSTSSDETWVIGPGGCDGTTTCRDKRGGLFYSNKSSTWDNLGYYELGLDPQLGFGGYGDYGLDNVDLSDEIIIPSQIVSVINTTEYWLGMLGLGVVASNFTNANQLTFLSSLVENQSLIPSHSYSYTAGAYYRLKGVPSSLTLGGYDANRFEFHDATFTLDSSLNPSIAVNEIAVSAIPYSTSNQTVPWSSPLTLLGSADSNLFTIDSSTPYLWLPETVCDEFAAALGLTYNSSVDLYTFVNSTQHDALVDWNMTFTFSLANLPGSSSSVEITLPYDAFDLQLSYPYPGYNITYGSGTFDYFPLKRAANDSQYTIGRVFLQESYLIVDYERNNFSVYPAKFSTDALQNIALVDISRPKNSTYRGPVEPEDSSLGTGIIVGIVVAAIIIIALIIIVVVYLRRRRRRALKSFDDPSTITGKHSHLLKPEEKPLASEVPGDTQHPHEAPTEQAEIHEMPGSLPFELPGSDVLASRSRYSMSAYDAQNYKNTGALPTAPKGHDPHGGPVEMDHDDAVREDLYYGSDTNSSMPAYSPSRVGQPSSPRLASEPSILQFSRNPSSTAGGSGGRGHTRSIGSNSNYSNPLFTPLTPDQLSYPTLSPQEREQERGIPSPIQVQQDQTQKEDPTTSTTTMDPSKHNAMPAPLNIMRSMERKKSHDSRFSEDLPETQSPSPRGVGVAREREREKGKGREREQRRKYSWEEE
ncbi:MAG: hypothetical protein M1834_005845 [Cirrosporium novae-zelandiae]|nr:MAG: hypothetical protein M1834_005845 [Cirrosporium novae-zelandiae]